jgi:hypothetical protein
MLLRLRPTAQQNSKTFINVNYVMISELFFFSGILSDMLSSTFVTTHYYADSNAYHDWLRLYFRAAMRSYLLLMDSF